MKNKINLLLPVAGMAQRFLDENYVMPKPLITVNHRHMIDWALDSIEIDNCNLIFVVRDDHIYQFKIDEVLAEKFGDDIQVVVTDGLTDGAASTCLLAKSYINNDLPLVIYTPDVYFGYKWDPMSVESDGHLLTFKSNSSAHSYAALDDSGFVKKTAEKKVISENAAVGVYYFKTGSSFVSAAEEMINNNDRYKEEFYICPVYNYLIDKGHQITISPVEKMHVLGTPSDLEFFVSNVITNFGDKYIALCSDHSGITLKELFKSYLDKNNIKYIDFGCYTTLDQDYPDYVSQAASSIISKVCSHGLGFCKSGQGVNIAANKILGIRGALVMNSHMAEYAIRHNAANFFSIPQQFVEEDDIDGIIKALIDSSFDGGRHKIRIDKFESYKGSI